MDGLALLCALHADGPQSLQRLRRSGCPSLESVATFELERLAEMLASTPNAALRFQREAQHLLARLGSSAADAALLEVEDTQDESVAAGLPPTAVQHPYDEALARWRELDALEAAQAAAEPIVEESSAPAPRLSPRMPLSALEGLADAPRALLERVGIVDVEGLATCEPLEMSVATGLEYSNAVRLRALAKRALAGGGERFSRSGRPAHERVPIVPLEDYILRPSPRGVMEPREETAGGPFA